MISILIIMLITITVVYFFKKNVYCNNIENISISDSLLLVAYDYNYDYCNLIREALIGKEKAIIEFSLLEFSDGMIYEHGEIIIKIIKKIGERKFLNLLRKYKISYENKRIIYYYVLSGFPLQDEEIFKKKFPQLYKYLQS